MSATFPIGRLFLVGVPGTALDSESRALLQDEEVGGVILFAHNLVAPDQVRDLTREIRVTAGRPVMIAVDQEGGPVSRLPSPPYPRYPAPAELGGRGVEEEVEAVASEMATALAGLGIDTNLAPVLDVVDDPHSAFIADRSFGGDPERVTRLGRAFVRGCERAGVLPCVKHFPGHGSTVDDSHQTLPRVDAAEATLQARDLAPFRALIERGGTLVMPAHVRYSALDPILPATLSERILRGWLRDELGFAGVVISDDMEMRAITDHFRPADIVRRYWSAGGDLVLVGHDQRYARALMAAAEEAIADDDLDVALLEESLQRVQALQRPTWS
ncbi:MAG: beta-N-acetylhexosaminidase [Nitrospirota bacterium]|jgi:beta-N-acetylhexosaminidase